MWEVLTRELPFKHIELAFGIMWSVHKGNKDECLIEVQDEIEFRVENDIHIHISKFSLPKCAYAMLAILKAIDRR